jgi:hypothetical protein
VGPLKAAVTGEDHGTSRMILTPFFGRACSRFTMTRLPVSSSSDVEEEPADPIAGCRQRRAVIVTREEGGHSVGSHLMPAGAFPRSQSLQRSVRPWRLNPAALREAAAP